MFKIDPTRSGDVLIEVLGVEFNGVLGCDYYSAYRRYLREFDVSLQFCLAHLIRDVKFLTTLPDARDRMFMGPNLREALRGAVWGDPPSGVADGRAVPDPVGGGAGQGATMRHTRRAGDEPLSQPGEAFRGAWGELFPVHHDPQGVEPTNNLAEQAIRFVVIDRLITQGTRSERGNRWCERIWTVIATCTQQGRSVFEYLEAAVGAWFAGTEPPLLLPGV